MPISFEQVKVGVRLLLNGRLHKDSYGKGLQSKVWKNYEVHIVRIINENENNYEERKCPILLGDDNSEQLGWVSWDELTTECRYIKVTFISY